MLGYANKRFIYINNDIWGENSSGSSWQLQANINIYTADKRPLAGKRSL